MRLRLNLIWLVFGGIWVALGYALAALVMCILIITIPFGVAAGRMALFCLWPFGRTLVRKPGAGAGSMVALTPFGREIVDIDQAHRVGLDRTISL